MKDVALRAPTMELFPLNSPVMVVTYSDNGK